MKVAIGCDVYGYPLKLVALKWLAANGHQAIDAGCHQHAADEKIADYADAVAQAVLGKKAVAGILLCKSGGFMAIRANRHPGIRAVMAIDGETIAHDREASDANVLCFAAHYDSPDFVEGALAVFFETEFESLPRRVKRLKRLDEPVKKAK